MQVRVPTITAVDCLILSIFAYLLNTLRDYRRRRGIPYPPGPRSWPIIGNLLDAPKQSPWAAYADMSKKHGDVVCLHIFGKVIVVLCSQSAVKDLLEKRGEIYSDRPTMPILEIMKIDWLLALLQHKERWREGRKLVDRSLRPGATFSYRRMIEEKARGFLGLLLAAPDDFRDHIRLLQGQLIMSLTYGYDLKSHDDKMIVAPVQVTRIAAPLVLPGALLVNHLPFLRHIPSWVPRLNYESLARIGRELGQRMMDEPINFVKNAMQEGTAAPSLAREHLQEMEELDGPERQTREGIIKETLGSMFQVQTVSAMSSLFLALTLYPEVQKRAQAELDSVVSRDRLPTFDDRPRLPYIEALCKEVLRWNMVTPMALPHASSKDDIYKGFFIPKGSVMFANTWAILHDPESYPEPETFNPNRFLNDDGTFQDDPTIVLAFGVGKRICPGRHFAEATLFMVAASVLSVYNVTKARDEYGNEIPVKDATPAGSSLLMHPEKFACSITPRDEFAKDLIVATTLA
ncbi:cytochrome P450 [Lactifluus subvellereus]|nr:cytochrome P450 [Lactifluus subvellereus]